MPIPIDMENEVHVVVAHDGVSANIYSEDTGQFQDAPLNPAPTVRKASAHE